MAIFGQDIGIDLGTATVLVYVKGKGIVLREPSVVAMDKNTGKLLCVGEEAQAMLGRTPGNIVAMRPLRDGVISDYDMTEKMLKEFIRKVTTFSIFKPRLLLCVPSGITEVEERAVIDAGIQAGARRAYLIEEPVAAAIGAGIDITQPDGHMVVDIGGGTADVAVISLGGVVESVSIKTAGDEFDAAVVKYVRNNFKVTIGERTAEDMKKEIGCVYSGREIIKEPEAMQRDMIGSDGYSESSYAEMADTISEFTSGYDYGNTEVLNQGGQVESVGQDGYDTSAYGYNQPFSGETEQAFGYEQQQAEGGIEVAGAVDLSQANAVEMTEAGESSLTRAVQDMNYVYEYKTMEVTGRNNVDGLPVVFTVSTDDMIIAFKEVSEKILEAIKFVIERTPPELVSDLYRNGIVLTGGGSMVRGLDKLIQVGTGITVHIASDAISCVAEGTGKSLANLDKMQDGTINLARHKQMNY